MRASPARNRRRFRSSRVSPSVTGLALGLPRAHDHADARPAPSDDGVPAASRHVSPSTAVAFELPHPVHRPVVQLPQFGVSERALGGEFAVELIDLALLLPNERILGLDLLLERVDPPAQGGDDRLVRSRVRVHAGQPRRPGPLRLRDRLQQVVVAAEEDGRDARASGDRRLRDGTSSADRRISKVMDRRERRAALALRLLPCDLAELIGPGVIRRGQCGHHSAPFARWSR